MVKRRKVSNLLALAVLSYLTQGPMHPYEMGRTLQRNHDDRSIKFNIGSLYMVFRQLEKAGFIAEAGTSRDGQRPERTVYALTDPGRTEQRDWLRDLVEQPRHEYPHFGAALSLIAALSPDEATGLLRRRLDHLARQCAELRSAIDNVLASGLHPLFQVEEEYRLALLKADSAFAEDLIARIEDPGTGWRPIWAQLHASRPSPEERTLP
ncbi:MAG: PadR family transcriptional regulator [Streptosporangiaceae bacterium]